MNCIKKVFFRGLFLLITTLTCRPNNGLELQTNLSTLAKKLSEMNTLLEKLAKPTKPVEIPEIPQKFLNVINHEKLFYQVGVLPNNTDSLLGVLEKDKKKRKKMYAGSSHPTKAKNIENIEIGFNKLRLEISDDYRNSGYHALRDSFYVYKYLTADDLTKSIGEIAEDTISAWDYAEMLMIAKPDIINYRTGGSLDPKNGGWLVKNDLSQLIKSISDSRNGLFMEMRAHQYDKHITVIDNIEKPSKEVKDTIENLKKKPNYFHVFLLAYPDEYKDKPYFEKGKTIHWIAIIVYQKDYGKQQGYFVADSQNKDRFDSEEFKKLKQLLTVEDS